VPGPSTTSTCETRWPARPVTNGSCAPVSVALLRMEGSGGSGGRPGGGGGTAAGSRCGAAVSVTCEATSKTPVRSSSSRSSRTWTSPKVW